MNVATALNKRYLPYTGVMLTSLCQNQTVPVDCYLLHGELEDSDIEWLRQQLKDYAITIHPICINPELFAGVPVTVQWSIETYYRLAMIDLLPDEVDRLFYIDGDIIINQSLDEVYQMDFNGNDILVAEDCCGEKYDEGFTEKQKEMFRDMLADGFRYFNAGFVLMNISQMKKHYNFQVYKKAMEEWDYNMSAVDQDIMNYVHGRRVDYFDFSKWNLFGKIAHAKGLTYEYVKENAAVIHYAGDKPWNTTDYHYDVEQLWWDYAKTTPFYNELLESFLWETLENTTLETILNKVWQENCEIRKKKEQSLQMTQKLMQLIEGK